jgi:2-phospho-L-lactate/phosphoenolpyruvate guanylyltransferase
MTGSLPGTVPWAIIPAKSPARGKSRLRPVLADRERVRFARQLFEHVLDVATRCELGGVLVATDGEDVAALAGARGAQVLFDTGDQPLSRVVDRALAEIASRGAGAGVVLMADLPWIEPGDVHALLGALDEHDVALVRDHLGRHTNALAMAPAGAMLTCFGLDDSFAAHCQAARRADLRLAVVDNDRIAFDVDGPEDHLRFMRPRPAAET